MMRLFSKIGQSVTHNLSRNAITHTASKSSSRYFADLIPGIGKGKTSTGLVGLPVDHDAIPKILEKYQALLDKAKTMPSTAQYRINIEKICNHRINAAKSFPDDPEKVEELCNCGQVEELVVQADNEMQVMDMYLRNRWWEYVKETRAERIENILTLLELNQAVLSRVKILDPKIFNAYSINTAKVAEYRIRIIQNASKQLEKNPNKIGKTEARLLTDINPDCSIQDLIIQAETELKLIDQRTRQ